MDILIPEYKIERRVRALAHALSEEHKEKYVQNAIDHYCK